MLQEFLDLQGFVWEGKPLLLGASEENKALDESLKQKKSEVQKMKGLLEKERGREKLMNAHYNDLKQEINYVQQMQNAQKHELEIEGHNRKLLSREKSRLMQEINSIKKELEALSSRKENRKAAIAEHKEKTEALKLAIQWEEEALLKRLRESAELEKDKIALIKYTHQDDSRIKELNLLLERLSKEARDRKTALDNTDTDVFIAQSELDRVQDEFRKSHDERQGIISNWEKVLHQLQQRNEEIDTLSKQIADMKEEENVLTQKLNEQQQMLAAEKANNEELEKKISEREGYAAKSRLLANDKTKQENDLRAELQTLRNISTYLSYQVQNTQKNIERVEEQLRQRNSRLESMEKSHEKLQSEIDAVSKEAFDADYCSRQLEKLLQKENSRLNIVQHEFVTVQNAVLKYTQDLKEAMKREKAMETEVKGAESANRNLTQTISNLDNDRLTQQTMMYRINLSIEQMEHRIRLMEGELMNEEERLQMENEKSRLQAVLDKKNSSLTFLNQQVKTMMEKINVSVKTLDVSKKQNAELVERIDFLEFFITNSQKSLKQTREQKECLLVDECLAKLQLNRYQELLRQKNESVMDLHRNQIEFEAAMKERILELEACRDLMCTEVRKEEEECYQTRRQVQEYEDKLSKLKTRYEVIMNALGIPEAGDGTQIDLLVKAEDEKRALKQERDELLAKVLQSEEDLHALRNTLWLIRASTEQFRQALNPPGLTAEENEKLKILEKELQDIDIEIHTTLQSLQDVDGTVSKLDVDLKDIEDALKESRAVLSSRREENEALKQDIDDLDVKLRRAEKSNSRLLVDVRQQKTEQDSIEDDIRIRLLREICRCATESLFSALREFPKLVEHVMTAFEEAGVPPPSRPSRSGRISQVLGSLPRLFSQRGSSSSSTLLSSEYTRKSTYSPAVISIGTDFLEPESTNSSHKSSARSTRSKKRA